MKKLHILIFSFFNLFILSSCSDILNTDSDYIEFAEDNTLNHRTDSVYSVMGIISKLQVIADRTVLLGAARGDLLVTTNDATADLKRLAAFDFPEGVANKYNRVSDYYAVINNCNFYLAHVDTTMMRHGRNVFKPEYAVVKAYRAWTYLQLAKAYGRVPLVLDPIMSEKEAIDAMKMPKSGIVEICNYFISDLTPHALEDLPDFGEIYAIPSRNMFLPIRVVLGDLCLWAGRYEEAARWYHDFLVDAPNNLKPRPLGNYNRVYWPSNNSELVSPYGGYSATTGSEVISFIPMEPRVFEGVVSDLPNVFNSTSENRYFFQVEPSAGMRKISSDQIYCLENKNATQTDTVYVQRTGFLEENLVGDLRFYSNYYHRARVRDEYTDESAFMQRINKVPANNRVITYRLTMVYLHYIEALNRAGYPQTAFTALKYGLCDDYIKAHVDSVERSKAGSLIAFDKTYFDAEETIGLQEIGSGDTHIDTLYALPMPAAGVAATRKDTVNYQIPLVENLIVTEMALEGAFEGSRYYDLMRVALRRNDPSFLADPISRRTGEFDAKLNTLLLNQANWYLPLR